MYSCTSQRSNELDSLNEGAKVSYEEKENRGKMSAENLRVC
jgi:CspA family cold shock protein